MEQKCSKMAQAWPQRDHMVQSRQDIGQNGPEMEINELMWTKWDKKCWVWTSNGNWTRNRPKGSKIVWKWNKMHLDGRKLSSAVHPEFHLSMTNSSGFIREGSGSTFEVCHALLTPFWLPLRSSESQNYLWNLVTYLNPEFQLSIINSSGFIE